VEKIIRKNISRRSKYLPFQKEIIAAFKRSNPEKNSPFFDFK